MVLTPCMIRFWCLVCMTAIVGRLAAAAVVKPSAQPMALHLLNDTSASGAVCLDGSPAGFYFAPSATGLSDWQVYFEGGGWCMDEADCWERSNGNGGSSSSWTNSMSSPGGMMSDDCDMNTEFCTFNRVYIKYCDGNSFTGNREAPLPVIGADGQSKQLFFRGKRILEEILEALAESFGLRAATRVLLTGCSAGGLAAYIHADRVQSQLKVLSPGLVKYKVAPMSGFFLEHVNLRGEAVYATQMRHIFELANSSTGVNQACMAAYPAAEQWRCNFAQYAYAHTNAPIFPLNSALDAWQTICILDAVLPSTFPNSSTAENRAGCCAIDGWAACASNPEACVGDQVDVINAYIQDFQNALLQQPHIYGVPTFHKSSNGAFIHSCHTHCEAQTDEFFSITVANTTMSDALNKWWHSELGDGEPADQHTYSPCTYASDGGIAKKCNPTCCSEPNCAHMRFASEATGSAGVHLPRCPQDDISI